jgi:hypothetical protein
VKENALIDLGESVNSQADFVQFLRALYENFQKEGRKWENNDLGNFLEALWVWSDGCEQYYLNCDIPIDPSQPQWRVFADMLMAARIYE